MASGRMSAGADPSSSHLARLIDAESIFEARLSAAREEAERIVAAARAAAEVDGPSDAELAASAGRLRSQIATETESRLAEIEARRRAESRLWEGNEEVVARLARAAVDRLLEPIVGGAR